MGTTYHITTDVPPGMSAEEMQTEIDARLETVNDQMSSYRPESELSRFNRFTGTDWFEVSGATAKVVSKALEIHRESGGAFDPTVAPLVNLWQARPNSDASSIPDDGAIHEAMSQIGAHELEVRTDPPALKKDRADITLDLSAIAKGYGVDVICEYLEEIGSENYLVELGGEVRTRGLNPQKTPWQIHIHQPAEGPQTVQVNLKLAGRALATSSHYRHLDGEAGQRRAHTIDPLTGRPVEHELASVSVVATDCMTADALATTLMVMGPEEGYTFAEEKKLSVFLIIRDGAGFTEKATPGFQQFLTNETEAGSGQ